jgi:predicted phage tail protein
LLSPTVPTPEIDNDPRTNKSFSGIQNVGREGVPVPIAYGEVIVGSVVISAGLNVEGN